MNQEHQENPYVNLSPLSQPTKEIKGINDITKLLAYLKGKRKDWKDFSQDELLTLIWSSFDTRVDNSLAKSDISEYRAIQLLHKLNRLKFLNREPLLPIS